jgi:hypothetical protein
MYGESEHCTALYDEKLNDLYWSSHFVTVVNCKRLRELGAQEMHREFWCGDLSENIH